MALSDILAGHEKVPVDRESSPPAAPVDRQRQDRPPDIYGGMAARMSRKDQMGRQDRNRFNHRSASSR